jgi:hypothetical protein
VGRSILKRWEMSADIIDAACDHEATEERGGPADLRDVLHVARCLGTPPPGQGSPDPGVLADASFRRLQLDSSACGRVLSDSAGEIASLRAALVD